MVISGRRVSSIDCEFTSASAVLNWNSATERFDITSKGPDIKINVNYELVLSVPPPGKVQTDWRKLYETKLAGVLLLALEFKFSDGTYVYRLFPYDPTTETIWSFDPDVTPGNHWSRASVRVALI